MQAVIFDMDGVVVDSIPLHLSLWPKLLAKYNLPMFDMHDINGMSTLAICRKVCEGSEVKPEVLLADKEQSEDSIISLMPFMSGALDAIEILRPHYRLALATSATKPHVDLLDSHLHLLQYFELAVTSSDVVAAKPAPDIFLKAAERLKVIPRECVVIEDAANGLRAAKAAGMKTIALLNPYLTLHDIHEADMVVSNLEEITPGLIADLG